MFAVFAGRSPWWRESNANLQGLAAVKGCRVADGNAYIGGRIAERNGFANMGSQTWSQRAGERVSDGSARGGEMRARRCVLIRERELSNLSLEKWRRAGGLGFEKWEAGPRRAGCEEEIDKHLGGMVA